MTLLNKQIVLEHLYKRLIETAINNVGVECDASDVFEETAKNRLQTWVDEIETADAIPIKFIMSTIREAFISDSDIYAYSLITLMREWAERKEE